MTRVSAVATIAAACLTAACLPADAFAQTATDTRTSASLFPARTTLFFSIPSVEEFRERFNETKGSGLLTGPETADLRQQFMEQYRKASQKIEEEIDLSLDQLLNVAKEEFSLGVTEPQDGPISLVLIIGVGSNTDTVDTIVGRIQDAYKSQGGSIETSNVDGVEIIQAVAADPDVPHEKFGFNYFIADGKWVIGTSVAALEAVIDRWDGDSDDTLAEEEQFTSMMERVELGRDRLPAMMSYVDPMELARSAAMAVSEADPQAGQGVNMALGFLPLTGLQNFRGISSATDFGGGEVEGEGKTFIKIDRPTNGLLEVFKFAEGDHAPPAWVSDQVAAYASFTWAIDDAYAAIEQTVDQFQGRGATQRQLDQIRDMPGGPGLHIKDDVIDQLEGTVRTFTIPSEGTTTQNLTPEQLANIGGSQVFALKLKRTHNMGEVLAKLAESQPGQLESRDFRGTTIYEFEPANVNGQAAMVGGVAIAEDHLMIATDVTMLEAVIRGGGSPLADSSAYQRAVEDMPTDAASLGFNNPGAQLKGPYEMARNGAFDDLIRNADDDFPAEEVIAVLHDLPAFDSIVKYFGFAAGYTTIEDDGYLMYQRQVTRGKSLR